MSQLITTGPPGVEHRQTATDGDHPVDLCRVFVELMVSRGLEAMARRSPGQPVGEVDWAGIWAAGDGLPSVERAVGRIVIAGYEAVRACGAGPDALAEMDRLLVRHRTSGGPGARGLRASPLIDRPEHPAPARPEWIDTGATEVVAVPPAPAPQPPAPQPPTPVGPVTSAPVTSEPADLVTHQLPLVPAPPAVTIISPPAAEPLTRRPPIVPPTPVAPAPVLPPTAVPAPDVGPATMPVVAPGIEPLPAVAAPAPAGRGGLSFTVSPVSVFNWLLYTGAVILLFVVWQLWGTNFGEHQAQSTLGQQFNALVHPGAAGTAAKTSGSTKAVASLVPITTTVPTPAEGSVVAKLDIPAIGTHVFVVQGTAEGDLSKGPGHYLGTSAPGQAGNIAIAGHRTTFGAPFYRLGNLKVGDQITLTDTAGAAFTYQVSAAPTAVPPSDVAVLNYFGDNRLTLTTCTPPYSATQRLVVVATLVTTGADRTLAPAPVARDRVHITLHDAATVGWRVGQLPLVLLVVVVVVLLGAFNRRLAGFYGRGGRWLILIPLWTGALYVLFQTLLGFLPPSL